MPIMKFSCQVDVFIGMSNPNSKAIQDGLLDVIQTLLEAGADVTIARSVSDVTEYVGKTKVFMLSCACTG